MNKPKRIKDKKVKPREEKRTNVIIVKVRKKDAELEAHELAIFHLSETIEVDQLASIIAVSSTNIAYTFSGLYLSSDTNHTLVMEVTDTYIRLSVQDAQGDDISRMKFNYEPVERGIYISPNPLNATISQFQIAPTSTNDITFELLIQYDWVD